MVTCLNCEPRLSMNLSKMLIDIEILYISMSRFHIEVR